MTASFYPPEVLFFFFLAVLPFLAVLTRNLGSFALSRSAHSKTFGFLVDGQSHYQNCPVQTCLQAGILSLAVLALLVASCHIMHHSYKIVKHFL
jgi:hypothetical protein